MSNDGLKRFIIIDAKCFFCRPEQDHEFDQNEMMVKFCLDALDRNYEAFIMFDDYADPKEALKLSTDAIEHAVEDYSQLELLAPIDPDRIIQRLCPYSAFQLIDKSQLVTDTRNNQSRPSPFEPTIQPLDDALFIISPAPEEDYAPLFSDYVLYIKPTEMEGYNAFDDCIALLNRIEPSLRTKKQEAALDGQRLIEALRDDITFQKLSDHKRILDALTEDPSIYDFLQDKPATMRPQSTKPEMSAEEFTLHRYFATLIRAEKQPKMAKRHQAEAAWLERVLIQAGGQRAVEAIKTYTAHILAPRYRL